MPSFHERKQARRLYRLCGTGDLAGVNALLRAGVRPALAHGTRPGERRENCIHLASRRGDFRLVKSLLAHGAGVAELDGLGMSPLEHACERDSAPVVRLLLAELSELPDSVNVMRKGAYGPMRLAAWKCGLPVLRMLVEAGFDQDEALPALTGSGPNRAGGNTPLHEACIASNWRALQALSKLGADPNIVNDRGELAFELSFRSDLAREMFQNARAARPGRLAHVREM